MSDFQKVRVTFTDADGKQVSAAMWARSDWPDCGYSRKGDCVGVFLSWHGEAENVNVTPIRNLPTGVGAVIRCVSENKDFEPGIAVLADDGWWHGWGDAFQPEEMQEWDFEYEVLSEGIQL